MAQVGRERGWRSWGYQKFLHTTERFGATPRFWSAHLGKGFFLRRWECFARWTRPSKRDGCLEIRISLGKSFAAQQFSFFIDAIYEDENLELIAVSFLFFQLFSRCDRGIIKRINHCNERMKTMKTYSDLQWFVQKSPALLGFVKIMIALNSPVKVFVWLQGPWWRMIFRARELFSKILENNNPVEISGG